jgi:WD40 repeat protein
VLTGQERPDDTIKSSPVTRAQIRTVASEPGGSSAPSASPVEGGPSLEPRYEDYDLLEVIGAGGMGIVYRARQRSLDREVALKTARRLGDPTKDATARGLFTAEAVVTGNLDHPGIVPIHTLERDSGGRSFYTMKCVAGQSWQDRMAQMPLQENLEVLLRVCDAVAFAHDHGVMHRDLKPANVMLGDYGEVFVMDWGLAVSVTLHGKAESIDRSDRVGGTPAYMAPEQAVHNRARIGRQTDIYLLGGMLFQICTGKAPHGGSTATECLMNAARNATQPTDQSGELLDIARRAMSTDPEDRHADAAEFQREVRAYMRHAVSISLADEARGLVERALGSGSYETFARAVFAAEEALALWEGNDLARQALREARVAYARAAAAGGNYELALRVLEPQEGEDALRAELEAALAERRRHARALRALKRTVLGLAALLGTALLVGFLWVRAERDQALRENYMASIHLAAVKAEGRSFDEVERLLSACQPRLRHWEWGFLDRLTHRELLMFAAHDAPVEALALTPDGRLAASGDRRGDVILWRLADGSLVQRFHGHDDAVTRLAFLPDGVRLASAGDDGAVRLWDARTGDRVADVAQHKGQVWALAVSPDGSLIASGGLDGRLEVLNVDHLTQPVHEEDMHTPVTALAFAPDGTLACGFGQLERPGSIRLSDPLTGKQGFHGTVHERHVLALAFSPDGQWLATGGWDGQVLLWNVQTGERAGAVNARTPVLGLAWQPGGTLLAGACEDRAVAVWQASELQLSGLYLGHCRALTAVAFGPDGERIVSSSLDGTVRVWDRQKSQQEAAVLRGHQGAVAAVAWTPDGRLVSTGLDGTLRLWAASAGTYSAINQAGQKAGTAVAVSPDGKLLALAREDGTVEIRRPLGGELLRTLKAHADVAAAVAFSPDGATLATAGWDALVKFWSCADGTCLHEAHAGDVPLHGLAFAPDGRHVAAASRDGHLYVVEAQTGRLAAQWPAHMGWVRCVAYSPDGRLLATGGDDTIVVLREARSGRTLYTLKGHLQWVKALAFTPDGRRLVSADDAGRVNVWDTASGRDLITWQAHQAVIWSIAVSPDGRTIATAGADGLVKLWTGGKRLPADQGRAA